MAAELTVEFSRPRPDLDEALIYCDMTSGPDRNLTTRPSGDECDQANRTGLADTVHIIRARMARAATRDQRNPGMLDPHSHGSVHGEPGKLSSAFPAIGAFAPRRELSADGAVGVINI